MIKDSPFFFSRIFKRVLLSTAISVVLFAVFFSAVRYITPHLTPSSQEFEQYISKLIEQPVTIGKVKAAWQGIYPVLKLSDIVITDLAKQRQLFHIDGCDVSINWLMSLAKMQLVPGKVVIAGTHIHLSKDKDKRLHVAGLPTPVNGVGRDEAAEQAIAWIFSAEKLFLKNVTLTWHDKNNSELTVYGLELALKNRGRTHVLWGHLALALPHVSHIDTTLILTGDVHDLQSLTVQGYVGVQDLMMERWLSKMTLLGVRPRKGKVSFRAWGKWEAGSLQEIQLLLHMNEMKVTTGAGKGEWVFNNMRGNIFWQRRSEGGWQVAADQLSFKINGHSWPRNHFALTVLPTTEGVMSYQFNASYLNLEDVVAGLLQTTLLPPKQRTTLASLQPTGVLTNLNLTVFPANTLESMSYRATADEVYQNTHLMPKELLPLMVPGWRDIFASKKVSIAAIPLSHSLVSPSPVMLAKVSAAPEMYWDIDTQFNQFSIKQWQQWPGVTELSGHLKAQPTSGLINLDSENMQVDFGKLFRHPISLDVLAGDFYWRLQEDGWEIIASNLYADNTDLNLYTNLSLHIPLDQGSPILNLLAGFSVVNAGNKSLYLPVGIMKPAVVAWLDDAVVDGKIDLGTVVVQGALADFPFDNHTGTFIVNASLQDVTLDYTTGWPSLTDLQGELTFDKRAMAVDIDSGKCLAALLRPTHASIPILAENIPAVLTIDGEIKGNLLDGLHFLQQSPLKKNLGSYLLNTYMSGAMQLGLHLVAPLEEPNKLVSVAGELDFNKGVLGLPVDNLELNNMQGQLHFTEKDVVGHEIHGQLLGNPVIFQVNTVEENHMTLTRVDMSSHIAINQLQSHFPSPWWQYVKGDLTYQSVLRLYQKSAKAVDTLTFYSDLRGVGVDFPEPLGKAPAASLPTSVILALKNSNDPLQVDIKYHDRLSAALIFAIDQGLHFIGGEVRLGQKPITEPNRSGLLVTGNLPTLPWDQWKAFFANREKSFSSAENSVGEKFFKGFDIKVDNFPLFGQVFSPAQLQLARGTHNWQLGIQSTNVMGKITIPDAVNQVWNAVFQRLYLANLQSDGKKVQPTDIPPLDFRCEDLRYDKKSFGHVELSLRPLPDGVRVRRLMANKLGAYLVSGSGLWREGRQGAVTALNGTVTSNDLAAALRSWDVPPALFSNRAKIDFDLNWPSSPKNLKLTQANGKLNLDFTHGRIADVGSGTVMNLGKMLSLLSISSLTRRLKFDFSDLTEQGFAFDRLTADFRLEEGNAFTRNMSLQGPVAGVIMRGRIGLTAEDYDLYIQVQPHITSSVPLVATLAGGPVVGAVAWFADRILGSQVEKITASSYRMTGPWSKPIVQQVNVQ